MNYLDMAKAILARRERLHPADLPAEWHFLWDERAAIMEADGKMPREQAEAYALEDIIGMMRREQSA